MPVSRRTRRLAAFRGVAVLVAGALSLSSAALAGYADGVSAGERVDRARAVSFQGYELRVPNDWQVVDLAANPHACLRFDSPAIYLGPAGDQADCPSPVVGGAPGVQLQAFGVRSLGSDTAGMLTVPASGDVRAVSLPSTGPASVAMEGAGVLVTLVYGASGASLIRHILASGSLLADARPMLASGFGDTLAAPAVGVSVPGDLRGTGFDTCAAPSQAIMDAWLRSSSYRSVGVYIGGMSRGCAQPNLTASWVSRQVGSGWHLLPLYVGRQAPCSRYVNRMSYDVPTARGQGEREALDAVAMAERLGISAPSTLYSDVEGYDSSNSRCVAAVMSYVSGWTFALHTRSYQAGVYSSAASGIHDLSTHYNSLGPSRPDDLFMAWWNHRQDVNGGSYVPWVQWSAHQRVHQFEGEVTEGHGGYTFAIDRNFLDVSSVVPEPLGCPTDLDFLRYPLLRWPDHGNRVRAAQCLLARSGFDLGAATGIFNWRTAAAIRAFKASRGLANEESSLGRWAWTALLSAGNTRFLSHGSTGPYVRKVQRTLTARLQKTVVIDGDFDRSTRKKVRAYQRAVNLTPTGTVGVPTWRALQSGR